jgi:putative ABC transport system ATP-binding protein
LLLLADEPTGNLDSRSGREVMELLVELKRRRGLAIVIVTHDPAIAGWAERTVQFGDGRVVEDAAAGSVAGC